jgi:hypothetical protein
MCDAKCDANKKKELSKLFRKLEKSHLVDGAAERT